MVMARAATATPPAEERISLLAASTGAEEGLGGRSSGEGGGGEESRSGGGEGEGVAKDPPLERRARGGVVPGTELGRRSCYSGA